MPRKEWISQNPYCRRSKLEEYEFDDVMSSYFLEVVQDRSRDYFQEVTRNTVWQTWDRQKLPTRQAISKYYEKISQYIWEKFIVNLHPSLKQEDVFDDLIDLIYGKKEKISSYEEIYFGLFSEHPFYLTKENIFRSLMFHLLSNRSKVIRGFKRDKFYLEFSRVFFICAIIDTEKIEFRSIYSVNEPKISNTIAWACKRWLGLFLRENPM